MEFYSRTAIKGQALADFMIECLFTEPNPPSGLKERVQLVFDGQVLQASWTLYVDGSTTANTSGVGVILTSPEGFKV